MLLKMVWLFNCPSEIVQSLGPSNKQYICFSGFICAESFYYSNILSRYIAAVITAVHP